MPLSPAEKGRIIAAFNAVDDRHGWDFSRLRVRRSETPWDYIEVARSLLKPTDRVLDMGTGGGEKLQLLAGNFDSAIAIDLDPEMIDAAKANLPEELAEKIEFRVGDSNDLLFEDATFDAVLNRHSVVNPDEVVRVLRPDGLFVNQDVGPNNLKNLIDPWRYMGDLDLSDTHGEIERFKRLGCEVLDFREYDVEYVFLDEESLFFQLKAMPMPIPVVAERDAELIAEVMESSRGSDGAFYSNEHRFLRVVRKAG